MKAGRTLTEMAKEIDRQQKTKRDFVAPTQRLKFAVVGTNGGRRVDLRMDRAARSSCSGRPTTSTARSATG